MTSLSGNIINRVRRLPKPANAAEALQPLFEAVSNGMHAVEDACSSDEVDAGRIDIVIENLKSPTELTITVSDTGVGLDPVRFEAFHTTDTDFKIKRGGKGIGRLLWLDAFDHAKVASVFQQDGKLFKRSFDFVLDKADQIRNESLEELAPGAARTGTITTFRGLRGTDYQSKFPTQPAVITRHFGSHFLAEFILGKSPTVTLTIGAKTQEFPAGIRDLLIEERGKTEIETPDFGKLTIAHFIFRSAASAGFEGTHQLHLVANGRTVMTRKIDGLVGVGRFGPDGNAVYHGCVLGQFLDDRVNQERTHFNFDEAVADQIAKACAQAASEHALKYEVADYDAGRLQTMEAFLNEYPSFRYAPSDQLLGSTPKNATKAEQYAQALIPHRIRRDLERKQRVQSIVSELGEGHELSGDFGEKVRQAADDVRDEEKRQLTEYVLRRKMVLDVMDVLLRRLRELPSGTEDHYLEETLHQFICPMKVRGDDPNRLEQTDHDLWIVDERLAFARYFASDVPVSKILKESKVNDRPDLLIWDKLHGLGMKGDEPLRRVMLVEFKKPGRKDYEDRYSPLNQISRYLNALAAGEIESFENERVRIAPDCVFHCYVVADIVGNLDVHTSTWRTTADGRGRWMDLGGKFKGTIEIIEWRDLVADARSRNAAFIEFA